MRLTSAAPRMSGGQRATSRGAQDDRYPVVLMTVAGATGEALTGREKLNFDRIPDRWWPGEGSFPAVTHHAVASRSIPPRKFARLSS